MGESGKTDRPAVSLKARPINNDKHSITFPASKCKMNFWMLSTACQRVLAR